MLTTLAQQRLNVKYQEVTPLLPVYDHVDGQAVA